MLSACALVTSFLATLKGKGSEHLAQISFFLAYFILCG
jgi:hypothetical protein